MAPTNRRKKSPAEADDQKTVQINTSVFWSWFESIEPALGIRAPSMRRALSYLDTLPGAITIVETGCARDPGNWAGDGGSTMIWDRYVQSRETGSHVYSVDLDPKSVIACQEHISENVTLTQSNSVPYLYNLKLPRVDLLYLDSYDIDWEYWQPSAAHHLKEISAARHLLRPETLVMVDDCPAVAHLINNMDNTFAMFDAARVGGKGRWVSEFAADIGAKLMFHHYQIAYTGISAG